MRRIIVGVLMAFVLASAAQVNAGEYQAGFMHATAQGEIPFDVLIAYPTVTQEKSVDEGGFTLKASKDSPVAPNARFPIVLFAHGNGRRAGTPVPHHGLILELARHGFVVVAPFFPGGERPFNNRPRQVQEALDAALSDARIGPRVDRDRMGMIGYSFGAALALMNAGAKLNLSHLAQYCTANKATDPRACGGIPTDGSLSGLPSRASKSILSLKALVLLEPFGAPFDQDDLATLNMPILIVNAVQSDLNAAGNAYALTAALPKAPKTLSVPGSHFVFIHPCPPAVRASNPVVCKDPPDVDRGAVAKQLRRQVVRFLRSSL